MMQKSILNFNLSALKAYSAAFVSKTDWLNWAMQSDLSLPQINTFKATKIPMLQARRMTLADKMAIQLAMELIESHTDVDAIVFASRHGQLERTYKLLRHFFDTGSMSPTDFATAVHNATAGQFSILSKNTAPISSIAAEEQTFCAGLLEALITLQTDKNKVLFVMFDGTIPDYYRPYLNHCELTEPYALGMVLEKGHEWQLSWESATHKKEKYFPDGLVFLHNFYQKQPHFCIESNTQKWLFTKN